METVRHIIVGTAGHIDHGKSSLVEALTGTNPDRLEEEKRRGITIDLGFAFLELGDVSFGFVDVPGHERFVRNMLAGAGGIDIVLLVVAADESIKPQTREHFDICRLLGVPRGLVAITKSDLVDAEMLDLVKLEVEEFVRGSFLEGAPIVPVSARTGAGLDALKQELLQVAHATPAKDVKRHFRLPIDRSFATKGFGTVVTGTLISGAVKVEDEIEVYPLGKRVRVRGLHSGGKAINRAVAGQRTAVNLSGIDHTEVQRGMVLGAPGVFQPTRKLDARITLLASARPLKNRARAHFHQGSAEAIAEIILLEGDELAPGQSALAQLRLDSEVVVLPEDRFILRQFSPVVTIGGGVVIDARARRHRRDDLAAREFLETLETGSREDSLAALAEAMPRGLTLEEVRARTGWLESEIREVATKLAQGKRLRILGEQPLTIASSEALQDCSSALREAIKNFHAANPLLPGIPKQELRGRAGNPRPELYEAALADLTKAGAITIAGGLVQRAGHAIALSPEEARAKELIEKEFERAGLTVPSVSAVLEKVPIEAARAQKILQILLREGSLVKVAEDFVFHRTAVARLRDLIVTYRKERGDRITVVAFKDVAGVSRKYAIPLLEFLDREHVTRRVGDERVIL
ncbi:MAG TPA: selenocysteine-specific translation elongation factor [Candidatus Acidoferrum sp.]|nr:selenocysteine-specific translation elongation factor [Candidatus Acidoferrum sp.]